MTPLCPLYMFSLSFGFSITGSLLVWVLCFSLVSLTNSLLFVRVVTLVPCVFWGLDVFIFFFNCFFFFCFVEFVLFCIPWNTESSFFFCWFQSLMTCKVVLVSSLCVQFLAVFHCFLVSVFVYGRRPLDWLESLHYTHFHVTQPNNVFVLLYSSSQELISKPRGPVSWNVSMCPSCNTPEYN